MEVLNNLEPRYSALKLKYEDYVNILGISVESTTDDGGGSNIGYTDQNDYVEYKIYNSQTRKFTIDFRLLQTRMLVKFRLISLMNQQAGFEVMDNLTPVTNDWQSWTTLQKTQVM